MKTDSTTHESFVLDNVKLGNIVTNEYGGHHGRYKMNAKFVARDVTGLVGSPSVRELDTILQMAMPAKGTAGKRFGHDSLVASL